MGNTVEPRTPGHLIRRLGDLIDTLPFDPADIDLVLASDHVAQLSRLAKRTTAWITATLNISSPVAFPQRRAVEQLTNVMVLMADALPSLTRALAHTAHGFRTAAIPGVEHGYLRGDEAASRLIAIYFYIQARGQLEVVVATLSRAMNPAPGPSPVSP